MALFPQDPDQPAKLNLFTTSSPCCGHAFYLSAIDPNMITCSVCRTPYDRYGNPTDKYGRRIDETGQLI